MVKKLSSILARFDKIVTELDVLIDTNLVVVHEKHETITTLNKEIEELEGESTRARAVRTNIKSLLAT